MKNKCLSIICGLMLCSSVGATVLSDLSSENLEETFDTICWQETYHFQGYDFPLPSAEGYDSIPYIDYVLECRDVENCMLYRCNLAIVPTKHTVVEDTILLGDTLFFCEEPLMDAGEYECTLTSYEGCDSIVQLILHTRVGEVVVDGVSIPPVCADEGVVAMQVDVTGRVDSVQLVFAGDSLNGGLHDTIVPMTADGYIAIALDDLRAGVHKAQLVGYFRTMKMFEKAVSIRVYYPSSVMEQRWDDVICVLTHDYNGGYDFVAFQWYKNGEPLADENSYYLHQALEAGAEYSVLLTDSAGMQQMSCPLVIAAKGPEISVAPTLITKRQPVRCNVMQDASVYVYDALGRMVLNTNIEQGETYLTMPAIQGVYLMKVVLQDKKERNVKIIIK